MTFPEYTPAALSTCMESCRNISYPSFGIIEELGEFFEKLQRVSDIDLDSQLQQSAKILVEQMVGIGHGSQFISKAVRHGTVTPPLYIDTAKLTPSTQEELKSEIGDVLWNLNLLCHQLGFSIDDAAQYNIQKLAARRAANTIDANGDTIRTSL